MKNAFLVAGAVCLAIGTPVSAQELSEDKVLVLACLGQMEQTTTWNQCLNLMFQPCVGEEVGSDGHVACLKVEREGWSKAAENLQIEVGAAITAEGNLQLAELLRQWTSVIVQNCQDVAQSRAATGSESARLGCEITEIVGLTEEFVACLDGRSLAEYCSFKDQ